MRRIVLGLLLSCAFAAAQPVFEVASIKPAVIPPGAPEHSQYHMSVSGDASRIELGNASLIDLLRTAFRVNTYQISGPDWMATQKFDLVAKLPEGATREQVPGMLQRLLADRFGLTVHHAQVERAVPALVFGKNGPKLTASPADSDAPAAGTFRRSFGPEGSMQMDIRRMTMPALAELIGRFLDQSIADDTGLKGSYDLSLSFSAEDLRVAAKAAGVVPAGPSDSSDSSIASSLQRFGLNLEKRKLPVDLLVVDHLEKAPTAN